MPSQDGDRESAVTRYDHDVADHVQLAVECIEAERDDAAMAHLLAAWETQRAEAIARVVELLELCVHGFGGQVADEIPAPRAIVTASLLERGRQLRALVTLWPQNPGTVDDEGTPLLDPVYVETLRELPPDPRIGQIVSAWQTRFPMTYAPFDEDSEDEPELDVTAPSTIAFRELLAAHADWRWASVAHGQPSLAIKPASLSETHAALLRSAEMILRRRLFDDDDDRIASQTLATYADWLTARGDPRGAAMRGEIREWEIYNLAKLWFGPLRAIAYPHMETGIAKKVRFTEDGDADLDWRALEVGWRPGWSAVEELERPPPALLASVALPSLRRLRVMQASLTRALSAGATLPALELLEMLGWNVSTVKSVLREVRTKHLVLRTYCDKRTPIDREVALAAELLEQPNLPTLSLRIVQHDWFWAQSARLYREWKKRKPRVETLRVLGDAGERWVFTRDAVRVEWWTEDPNEFYVDRIEEVVAAGAKAITVRAKAALKPAIVGRLNKVRATITVEVAPELRFDDNE